MNKLISIIAAAAVAAVLFTGCTGDAQSTPSDAASQTESGETMTGDGTKSPDGYKKDFDGFVQYMTDNGFVSGDGVELTAAAIGASSGKRFTMTSGVGGTTKYYVELYEYKDGTQTSDAASATISNARADGSFHLFESTETITQYTLAVVSDDGRFLMLYTDNSESDDKNERRDKAAEAVRNFSK